MHPMTPIKTFAGFCLVCITLFSCVAPVNLNYDSARMLDAKEVEVTGATGSYVVYFTDSTASSIQSNVGGSIRCGITPKYNIGITYENARGAYSFESRLINLNGVIGYDFFELNNKFALLKERIALSLPVGLYAFQAEEVLNKQIYFFNPRLHFNLPLKENKANLNINPKLQMLVADGFVAWPGLSIGGEFSSNLQRWAIRPEVGFDGFFSAGIGLCIRFNQSVVVLE